MLVPKGGIYSQNFFKKCSTSQALNLHKMEGDYCCAPSLKYGYERLLLSSTTEKAFSLPQIEHI